VLVEIVLIEHGGVMVVVQVNLEPTISIARKRREKGFSKTMRYLHKLRGAKQRED
jgi:hypothetical protein